MGQRTIWNSYIAEWKKRAETIRKDSGGSIVFLGDPEKKQLFWGTEIGLEMDPEGFKPLTGVLRSKVADGKVGYRCRQSPVSRRGCFGYTGVYQVGTQVCMRWVHRCVSGGYTGVYRVGAQVFKEKT